MHNTELMMSLIVASTALAGLQAVVVNQVVQSGSIDRRIKRLFRVSAVIAFIFAIVTVFGATNWLMHEGHANIIVADWGFGIQMLVFAFILGGLTALTSHEY